VTLDSTTTPAAECWAAAVVETTQPGAPRGQQVAYVLRTAVKIYVQPPGLRSGGEITGLRVTSDGAPATPAPQVEVTFENRGALHVAATGTLEFRRPDNSLALRVPLPNVYALPGARQQVRVPLPELARGRYAVLATLDYGGADIAAALIEHQVP
jgi:P pilus assembly chaperone PapD